MNYFNSCLICNSNELTILKGYEKDYLNKCKKCGFVFATRLPTQQELLDEYAKYPRSNIISDITVKRYKNLLTHFETYRLTNNIIDVGAGDGHFSEIAKKAGWNSYATEFDDKSVELCRQKGVIVHQGVLNVKNYKKEFFDVIFSSEVLEHINNPVEEIRNFHEILRKGGLVYITTPNLNSVSHKLLKNQWNIFNYPEHLCYYNPKTFEKLFKENGFKKLSIQTTGFSPGRFYASKGNSTDKDLDEELRKRTDNQFAWKLIKSVANIFLNITKTGNAMKGMFIKL